MPLKVLREDREKELIIKRILYVKQYSLTLSKDKCWGCELCWKICPKEAVEVRRGVKVEGGFAKPPSININEGRCHYCGICDAFCPFGAIKVKVNGEHIIPVVKKESFPQLIRNIEIKAERCRPGCVECEKACPLQLIKVKVIAPDGREVSDLSLWPDKEGLKVSVGLDKDSCPCCGWCEAKCPYEAVRIHRIFYGSIKVNHEKCPEGCKDCLDICPVKAMYLSNGRVHVYGSYCIYCGACKHVCPVEGALEVYRSYIRHTSIRSGAWSKALEKLTSTSVLAKELKLKGFIKARDAVEKRIGFEEA